MGKPWWPDELTHAGAEHLDPAFVSGFDRKQGYPDFAEDVDILCAGGSPSESTLIDFGAGTGRLALAAAHRFGRVIAADVSPAMNRCLRERAVAAGLSNIDCVVAGFLSYQHTGPPVDAVYTRHALHQLPDFWKVVALERIAGMLRPGGIFRLRDLIFDVEPSGVDGLLDSWLAAAVDDPAEGYTRQDYAEHIRSEHSTFRWLLEPMLVATGFRIETVDFDGPIYGAYTCVTT
jgi:ubiquinone/menaquinone biosynthesis C-methylase UbiE